ncbi:hypothetical protein ACI77O_12235 [Pseudomonas tritici]|uniref:hypothetical protein n=1 Tax=Pseudomonas tritici TaxID=2745518 RepID=UPI00387B7304
MNNATLDFLYSEALAEVLATAPNEPEGIPSLADLTASIRELVGDEQLAFPDFEAFFAWFDVFSGYDQMDEGVTAAAHKPIIKVAFLALAAEGLFSI